MKGNRKTLVALTAILCAFILGLLGKLTAEFAGVISVVCTVYFGANAWGDHHGKIPDPQEYVASVEKIVDRTFARYTRKPNERVA